MKVNGHNEIGTSVILSERIYLRFPESTLDLLSSACWDQLTETYQVKVKPDLSPRMTAWCWLIFSLIVETGISGNACLDELMALTYTDICSTLDGYIDIPRAGGRYPVFLPDRSQAYAIALCNHLRRGRGAGRNRMGNYPLDGFILPDRSEPEAEPSWEEIRAYQEIFQTWLTDLGKSSGVHIRLSQLISLSRCRVFHRYPAAIAALLLGLHVQNPVRVEQVDQVGDYDLPLDLATNTGAHGFVARAPRLRLAVRMGSSQESADKDGEPGSEKQIPIHARKLRVVIQPLIRSEKLTAKPVRKQVKEALSRFLLDVEKSLNKGHADGWSSFIENKLSNGLSWIDADEINIWMIASWLRELAGSGSPPNTLSSRLNDILKIHYQFHMQLIFRLDPGSFQEFLSSINSLASRLRLVDSARCFYRYVSSKGIQTSTINFWATPQKVEIHSQTLPSRADVQKIVDYFLSQGREGENPLLAFLAGYYFGLRVSEVINLTVDDLVVEGIPTVYIYRSKRDKSRVVEGVEIPHEVLTFFGRLISARLLHTGGDRMALLMVNQRGKKLNRQYLNAVFARSFQACGIEISVGEKDSCTHLIRHLCANRWWGLGIPLTDIARKLGHSSAETTLHYLHIGPCLQKTVLERSEKEVCQITDRRLASLMGVTYRRLKQMEKSGEVEKLHGNDLKSALVWLSEIAFAKNDDAGDITTKHEEVK
jgi:site-specific recombinase XerD